MTQSEAELEENLLKQLSIQDYERVILNNEPALLLNLRVQLEKHNKTILTDLEFNQITNYLSTGTIFEKSKKLRDKMQIKSDDGTTKYIEFFNSKHWCQNLFQITSQVSIDGKYKNRYDVTILINGMPLVQIELKKRGLELKEAFNQILRYDKHTYGYNSALFQYVQVFVISNGVNTKYFSNNKEKRFEQTFFWADKENKNIKNLEKFTESFLDKCHLSKMIAKYIVLSEASKSLLILRPYQFWAVEAIVDKVTNSNDNGYVWHATGSGKTLTSFKASQILINIPKIDKVIFVVDRKDLDYQTTKEFNSFSNGSVDGTDNTKALVKQFKDPNSKLIVTTIQKLNTAIKNTKYEKSMNSMKTKNVVFIFDECHRSQFGETHKNINHFFKNNQMIGFTGTPIFVDNAVKNTLGKRTTKELFDECLHKYVITDAIADKNVLKFSIEYIGKYKENSNTTLDIKVSDIDTTELLNSDDRINKITDYIIANHDRKTHNKTFTAMMCVSSIDVLIQYYEKFKSKDHNLKIATIFSYGTNENDDSLKLSPLDDLDPLDIDTKSINTHSRDKLDEYIEDYNGIFGTKFSTKDTQSYYNYYNDISSRVKDRQIDILLVVNMFLTGFDSKTLNTMYVDKNLQHHGLIQAFSRTNRILNQQKSQGNIVCFRNLKDATDDAISLFSNKDAKDIILMESYEEYITKSDEALIALKLIAPDLNSIDNLINENDQLTFVKAFRDLIRIKNIMESFADYNIGDIGIKEQDFADYQSKYLDIKESIKHDVLNGKVSILNDVDFELELIHKDEITVSYILNLLAEVSNAPEKDKKNKNENIDNIINSNEQLRSKKELIHKFINAVNISSLDVQEEFIKFSKIEEEKELEQICQNENLHLDKISDIISKHIYDQKDINNADIKEAFIETPSFRVILNLSKEIINKLNKYIEKYSNL